jgi:hypothetical protein
MMLITLIHRAVSARVEVCTAGLGLLLLVLLIPTGGSAI